MKLFDQVRPATVEDVAWLRRAMRRELDNLRIAPELCNDLQLAFAEVATNIVTHNKIAAREIGLRIDLLGTKLRIEIEDDGGPFEEFATEWRRAARKELAAVDFNGLGLALANATLTNVTYTEGPPNVFCGWHPLVRVRPTVLIVEDDPTLLKIYTAVLSSNYRVLGANSVDMAVAMATTHTVDLILCDYYVGHDVGTSLQTILERDSERLPIPVIMMSADMTQSTRASAHAFGIEAFLQKPITAGQLRSAVDRGLATAGRRLTGLFRYFGAHADKLLSPPSSTVLDSEGAAHRQGNATAGGGDFLLHFPMPNADRFVLADVMGHGFQAKAAAIAFATIMRTLQTSGPASPAAFLTSMSKIVRADPALGELLATVIVIDRHPDGRFCVASAAHPPPYIVSANGVRAVPIGGPLLGMFDDYIYESIDIVPALGERIALLTDGIDPATIASGGRLPETLEQSLCGSIDAPLGTAMDQAAEWAALTLGPSPRDDWTIMLLESQPIGV